MPHRNETPAALLAQLDAIADETRLRLLHLLESQELSVVDLCDIIQLPQSTVSRHLKILADQKWVDSRRLATTNLYHTVVDGLDPAAQKLWQFTREQTEHWATLQQDALRLKRRLADRRDTDSQSFFAGAAAEWDKLRGELYGDGFSTGAMLSLLPRDLVIADLGCGTGPVAEKLAPHVSRVIGIDNSPAMLKAAKKRLAAFDNVELRKGELDALPIESASCTAAFLVLALTYAPEPSAVINEMRRILKPQGQAVIVDLLLHDREDFRRQTGQMHSGFAAGTIEQLLGDAGFQAISYSPVPVAPQARGPALFLTSARRMESGTKSGSNARVNRV